MRTYSEWIYALSTEAQNVYRALHNELCIGRVDTDRDAMLAARSDLLSAGYVLPRLVNDYVRDKWLAWAALNGATGELGFIHHGGVRRQVSGTNWWVMDMAYAPYRAFWCEQTILVFEGMFYGTPFWTDPSPHPLVIWDLVLWYPIYDSTAASNENIKNSDEHSADPQAYQDACALACIEAQIAVDAHFSGSGYNCRLMPNFGSPYQLSDAFYAAETPPNSSEANSLAVLAGTRAVEIQSILAYTGNKPTTKANALLGYLDWIDEYCAGGKIAAGHVMCTDATTTAKRDRAGLFAAAFYLMAYRDSMYCRYCTDDEYSTDDPSLWEFPEVLRAAHGYLGSPTGVREEVLGHGGVQGRLFKRTYQNGVALMYVQADGFSGTDSAVYDDGVSYTPMQFDGSVAAAASSFALSVGEGAVLTHAPVPGRIVPTTDSAPLQFVPLGGSGSHSNRVREAIEAPSTAEVLRCSLYGQKERLTVGTDPNMPQDINLCVQIIVWLYHSMTNGASADPGGFMEFPLRLLVDGVTYHAETIQIPNDSGGYILTGFTFMTAFSQAQMNALQVEIDTTSVDAGDWTGSPTRYQVATINLDLLYVLSQDIGLARQTLSFGQTPDVALTAQLAEARATAHSPTCEVRAQISSVWAVRKQQEVQT